MNEKQFCVVVLMMTVRPSKRLPILIFNYLTLNYCARKALLITYLQALARGARVARDPQVFCTLLTTFGTFQDSLVFIKL